MRKHVLLLALLALASALFAAGCGDDSDDSGSADSGGEALTKEDYIAQGDEICAGANEEIQAEAGEYFSSLREDLDRGFGLHAVDPSPAELQRFGEDSVIPNVESEINELRALPAPEGEEEAVMEIYDAAQDGLDQLEQDPSQLADEDAVTEAFSEANELAVDYGFSDCGRAA